MSTQYIFLDEGGNFDFSPTGTAYFTITAVSMMRPFRLHTSLDTYKYDLIEHSISPRLEMEYFHCAEDNRHIRGNLFDVLGKELPVDCVDAVVVEKRKTGPALRSSEQFYPRMLGYLLRFVLARVPSGTSEVVIFTDSIPVQKQKRVVEKALKTILSSMLPATTPYTIMHHQSRSHYGLQIADYVNWAILRKWERMDNSYYSKINHLIRSEFGIFRTGKRHYY